MIPCSYHAPKPTENFDVEKLISEIVATCIKLYPYQYRTANQEDPPIHHAVLILASPCFKVLLELFLSRLHVPTLPLGIISSAVDDLAFVVVSTVVTLLF